MNVPDVNASDPSRHASEPAPSRPWLRPNQLPLVKVLRLIKQIAKKDDVNIAEAVAIQAAMAELDSVGHFVWNQMGKWKPTTTVRELFAQYVDFCSARSWQPHRFDRFDRLLRLERKDARDHLGGDDTGTTGP